MLAHRGPVRAVRVPYQKFLDLQETNSGLFRFFVERLLIYAHGMIRTFDNEILPSLVFAGEYGMIHGDLSPPLERGIELAQTPLFTQECARHGHVLDEMFDPVRFLDNDTIIQENDFADRLYVVTDGFVRVVKLHSDNSRRTVTRLAEGVLVGEMGLSHPEQVRIATVEAAGGVRADTMRYQAIWELRESDMQVYLYFIKKLFIHAHEVVRSLNKGLADYGRALSFAKTYASKSDLLAEVEKLK